MRFHCVYEARLYTTIQNIAPQIHISKYILIDFDLFLTTNKLEICKTLMCCIKMTFRRFEVQQVKNILLNEMSLNHVSKSKSAYNQTNYITFCQIKLHFRFQI